MTAPTAAGATWEPRAVCARCRRPTGVCVCALLPALAPRTRVLILQHPKERRVAIGTAAMASRCLHGATVVVGTHVEANPAVRQALADPVRTPVLLWPGPDAVDLATSPPTGPISLLVVDGTWSTAKKMLRFNPEIAALPRYAIAPKEPSQYRIRREPRAECLSTIEALATALGVLEGEPDAYRAMLEPFRAMVEHQLDRIATSPQRRDRSRLLRRVKRPWPPPALSDPHRIVLVSLETNAWPLHAGDHGPEEIVHLAAIRADESARFEAVVGASSPLAPSVASHADLPPEVLLEGRPRERFRADFAAFLEEGDLLATWGTYAPARLREEALAPHLAALPLRRVAADRLHRAPGSLEACADSLGVAPRPLGRGRAGRRLGLMLDVLRALGAAGDGGAPTPERSPRAATGEWT
jgi:DTW domain-containing protein YfiP